MAYGRMMARTIATDKVLNSLSINAELVYLMTVPHLDRDGIIVGEPDILWGIVCPRRRELMDEMPAIIDEWVESGLVIRYTSGEDYALWFKGFTKNNTNMKYGSQGPSQFEPPPGMVRTDEGLTPDQLPTKSAPKVEVKEEVKEEEEGKEKQAAAAAKPDGWKEMMDLWDRNMPGMRSIDVDQKIAMLVDETSVQSVIYGIHEAVTYGKRFPKYVASCARNHAAGGGHDKPEDNKSTYIPDELAHLIVGSGSYEAPAAKPKTEPEPEPVLVLRTVPELSEYPMVYADNRVQVQAGNKASWLERMRHQIDRTLASANLADIEVEFVA